jgi:hypothetical protein
MLEKNDINLSGIDIIFEITRFCNMACSHCIRGDAQKKRISKDIINKTLSQLKYINTITFSGGEPALAVDLIEYTLDEVMHYGIEVANIYITTNGSVTKKSFFNAIVAWVNYCNDNEISGLRISTDNYHDDININPFKEFEEQVGYEGLQLYFDYSGAPDKSEYLISEGRASDNYYCTREIDHDIHLQDDGYIEGGLYVNAKGFVISTCDISYDTEDNNPEYTICHVNDDIQEKLAQFFNNHSELIYK